MEDAQFVCQQGADALGFVFYPGSPRYIPPEEAKKIINELPDKIEKVGVFVNESPERINRIADIAGLTMVQLHGGEMPEDVEKIKLPAIKAIRVRTIEDIKIIRNYKLELFLLDSFTEGYGGSGRTFDWRIACEAKKSGKIILSGGLNPENVADAIKSVRPYGVDVSSGVESEPGKKDRDRVQKFICAVRSGKI